MRLGKFDRRSRDKKLKILQVKSGKILTYTQFVTTKKAAGFVVILTDSFKNKKSDSEITFLNIKENCA